MTPGRRRDGAVAKSCSCSEQEALGTPGTGRGAEGNVQGAAWSCGRAVSGLHRPQRPGPTSRRTSARDGCPRDATPTATGVSDLPSCKGRARSPQGPRPPQPPSLASEASGAARAKPASSRDTEKVAWIRAAKQAGAASHRMHMATTRTHGWPCGPISPGRCPNTSPRPEPWKQTRCRPRPGSPPIPGAGAGGCSLAPGTPGGRELQGAPCPADRGPGPQTIDGDFPQLSRLEGQEQISSRLSVAQGRSSLRTRNVVPRLVGAYEAVTLYRSTHHRAPR